MLLAGAGATLLSADRAAAQAPTAPAPKAPPANAPSAAPPTKGPSKAAPANAPASAPSAAKAPPAKSPPPEPPSEDADAAPLQGVRTPEPTFRFPLLQEGSVLARAAATLRRDAESGTWVATLRDDLETERDREVTVLPSEVLEEMITHIRGRTEVQWFELTAMVLTYRQHNFLLPLMATPLSAEPPRPPRSFLMPPGTVPERAAEILEALHAAGVVPSLVGAKIAPAVVRPPPAAAAPTAPTAPVAAAPVAPDTPSAAAPTASVPPAAPPSTAPVDPERFAAEVEKALEERIKVVPRSGDAVPVPSPFAPGRTARGLSGGATPVLLPTHVRVQDRRGSVTRDPLTGTWRFVMQGERTDMGERGVELLPCAALERMERFVKQAETAPALLVSGRITRFEGRNFLLPSSFRTIASGRWISP